MSGNLLDTNVVSLLAPTKSVTSSKFLVWLEQANAKGDHFLSVVAIHEIERGITLLDREGATALARDLRHRMASLVSTSADRIGQQDTILAWPVHSSC